MSDANKQQSPAAQSSAKSIESLNAEMEKLRLEADTAKAEAKTAKAEAKAASEEKARIEEEKARIEEEMQAKSEAIDAEVSRQEETIRRQLKAQRKVRITIASGKDPKDRCPVPVAVNGREYLIERDKTVDVPQGVLDVLDLAVEQVPTVIDEGGQSRTVFQPAQRFSYRVLGRVDPLTGELEAS